MCQFTSLLTEHFDFFSCLVFLRISHMAGKAKRKEKRSARSRLVKQVFFTVQNNQLSK